MPKKRGKNRRSPRRGHLRSVPTLEERSAPAVDGGLATDLMTVIRTAMRAEHPLHLLDAVGSVMSALDPRSHRPFEQGEHATVDEIVDSFVGTDFAETTAALTVMSALTPDDVLRAHIRRELSTRRQPMPAWLGGLDGMEVTGTDWLTDILGDGDDYLLGARLPSGERFTALVYVDHNLGTVVKDAFTIGEPLDVVTARMSELAEDGQSVEPVDPAVARAAVTRAIEHGAMLYPPCESESWPMCRPVVEWLLRALPATAVAPERHEWTEKEWRELEDEFFASASGRPLDGDDERGLAESLAWLSTSYGNGDPWRWSVTQVEMLLTDLMPRKIVAEPAYLAKAPDLLRAWIRYGHNKTGVPADRTQEALAAVDAYEPEFQREIRVGGPRGADALAAMMLDAGQPHDDDADLTVEEIMLESLDRAVGGRYRLMNLDLTPLPDEGFEWAGVPDDVHDAVRAVLELCDRCADELFDVEHRTAARRFLGRAVVADPKIFRRHSKPERAAAAIMWVIGKANGDIGYPRPVMESQELLAWFGVKGSVAQRAEVFLTANGVNPHEQYGGMDLGMPDLLVSVRRRAIAELRDHYLAVEPG